MGFEGLLGNDRLKENLRRSIHSGRISHFYLICGPEGAGKHTLARLLAAAILCREADEPCLSCAACRKVMADTHPDVITVEEPEKKTLSVDAVRRMRSDVYIQPNEANKKIYLLPQELRVEGQNALLKILEEPPSYGVFILLADNPEKLLPTVRSRCTELKLLPLPQSILRSRLQKEFPQVDTEQLQAAMVRSGGWLGQAMALLKEGSSVSQQTEEFVRSFAARDAIGLMQVLVPMERWKREQLIGELNQWVSILQSALVSRSGIQAVSALAKQLSTARSTAELMDAIRHLQKTMEYAQGNVSVAAICGYLEWALR